MDVNSIVIAVFIFLLGACVGSFINVLVYRLPLGLSVVSPPSSCPNCRHRLAFYDNVPVLGWLWLGGRCRYCRASISPRYPIVEGVTGLIFFAHYLLLFHYGWGPYGVELVNASFGFFERVTPLNIDRDWPILFLHLWVLGMLLAASLIDLEHFIIPLELCWLTTVVAVVVHVLLRPAGSLGALHNGPVIDAVALGGGAGLLCSIILLKLGWMKRSFADEEPLLEKDLALIPEADRPADWTPGKIRREISREIIFLLPPVAFATTAVAVVMSSTSVMVGWEKLAGMPALSGFFGSLLGALVGGMIVWLFRILGSYGFGREAMGMGDVHLMFAVGAALGGSAAVIIFFLAPAFGLSVAVIGWIFRGRREIPYGPYLSLATWFVMIFYVPIAQYFAPGVQGLGWMMQSLFEGSPS